jgi:6-phosphogluconolactonase (cycloisomerase 2 family)
VRRFAIGGRETNFEVKPERDLLKGTKMMNRNRTKQALRTLGMLLSALSLHQLGLAQDVKGVKYLITNDNKSPNTATFFTIGGTQTAPTLTVLKEVGTGGNGVESGSGLSLAKVGSDDCAYVSNGSTENITAIVIRTQKYVGIYSSGSSKDSGLQLTLTNGSYLYASYTSSRTIATFQVNAGCGLTFVGDATAEGLDGGYVEGWALHGTILVVAYGDGSIESFNISAGLAASNGDTQFASGHATGLSPVGVDISKNGLYAVFGDYASEKPTAVEVSDIASGKLTPTVLYNDLGAGTGSTGVLLDPTGSLLYVVDGQSYQMTAVRFNEKSGKVSAGCVSAAFTGQPSLARLALESTSGTGGVVYVAEWSGNGASGIEMLSVSSAGTMCTLTEPVNSPVSDPDGYTLRSIAVWPPRPF